MRIMEASHFLLRRVSFGGTHLRMGGLSERLEAPQAVSVQTRDHAGRQAFERFAETARRATIDRTRQRGHSRSDGPNVAVAILERMEWECCHLTVKRRRKVAVLPGWLPDERGRFSQPHGEGALQ